MRVRAAHTHCQRGTVVWENDFSQKVCALPVFISWQASVSRRSRRQPPQIGRVDETNHAAAVARAATEAQAISGRPSCTGMMPSSGLPLFDLILQTCAHSFLAFLCSRPWSPKHRTIVLKKRLTWRGRTNTCACYSGWLSRNIKIVVAMKLWTMRERSGQLPQHSEQCTHEEVHEEELAHAVQSARKIAEDDAMARAATYHSVLISSAITAAVADLKQHLLEEHSQAMQEAASKAVRMAASSANRSSTQGESILQSGARLLILFWTRPSPHSHRG